MAKQLKAAILARRAAKAPRKKRTRPKPRQYAVADWERARDRVAAAERRIDNDRTNNPNWGRAGLERAQLELSVITSSYACAVSSSDGSIDLSHLEALPGPSCVSTVSQLKRERFLRARFAEANGNYHNISNTWLVRGFPSSSPLTPAMQSGLRRLSHVPVAVLALGAYGPPGRQPQGFHAL